MRGERFAVMPFNDFLGGTGPDERESPIPTAELGVMATESTRSHSRTVRRYPEQALAKPGLGQEGELASHVSRETPTTAIP